MPLIAAVHCSCTVTGHSLPSKELRQACDISRGYRQSTVSTGIQGGLKAIISLQVPNRIYRHSTVCRCPTGSTGTQESTGAQQNLQALNSLHVPNRIYRHSTGRITVQNAALFVLQFLQFTRNVILSRYFRTTSTCRQERKASHDVKFRYKHFWLTLLFRSFCAKTRRNASKFVCQVFGAILRGK